MAYPLGHLLPLFSRKRLEKRVLLPAIFLCLWSDIDLLFGHTVHQGLTHSLIVTGFIGLIVSYFVRVPSGIVWFPCVAMSHPLIDSLFQDTTIPYGIRLFWPISQSRILLGWHFIPDFSWPTEILLEFCLFLSGFLWYNFSQHPSSE